MNSILTSYQGPVLTKQDFVRRYIAGEFGNHSPTWNNIAEFLQETHKPDTLFHLRNRKVGATTWYDVLARHMPGVWESALRQGYTPADLYISEMAPTEKTLIQGEVERGPNGLDLYFSNVPRPMREALAVSAERVQGVRAQEILKHYLNPASWDWLLDLLIIYEDHVVEFSTYSVEWGTLPGYNTVFWEVRKY